MKFHNSSPTLTILYRSSFLYIFFFSPLIWKLSYFNEQTHYELGRIKADFMAEGERRPCETLRIYGLLTTNQRNCSSFGLDCHGSDCCQRHNSLFYDCLQSIFPLDMLEWQHAMFWIGCWGCKKTNVCLHKQSLLFIFLCFLSKGMWHWCQNWLWTLLQCYWHYSLCYKGFRVLQKLKLIFE